MKKVTLQEIANSLGISRTTVWKVFSGHEGVSDSLRTKVIAKAQELGYAIPEDFQYPSQAENTTPVNIAVAVCRPETSLFWMTIIHQIAKVFSAHNVNLVYTYLPTSADPSYLLPASLTNGSVHGIIVLNVYNERLLHLLAETQIPKVFLDTSSLVPPDELNGDLLLMESRTSVRRITSHLLEQGRTRIGFIGDIGYAQSNHERYEGFCQALTDAGKKPDFSVCLTTPLGIDTYREEIDTFLPFFPVPYAGRICLCQRLRCLHSDAAAGETWSSHTGGYCGIRLRQHHRGSSRRRPDNRTGFQRGSRCTSGTSNSVPDQTSTQAARNYVS